MDLQGKTIIVGVTGSIAAYWATELIGILKNMNADVRVVMTKNAEEFITPLTLQTVAGNNVLTDLFSTDNCEVSHIAYARRADVIIIAPATANIIGKIAHGIADDALSTIVMATKSPVIICPAMNNAMWTNFIVQENVEKLKKHGYIFVDPEYGKMVCREIGIGRLAQIESIIKKLCEITDQDVKVRV